MAGIINLDSSPVVATQESAAAPPSVQFSPSDRIQQLNKIDKEIISLLTTASSAITTLSSPTPAQATFKDQSAQYHASVQSIITSLKRQIYAMEQADIPLPGILTSTSGTAPSLLAGVASGHGGLDIGAISGRSDAVGRKMEGELWKKARGMVDGEQEEEEGEKVDLRMDVET